jgi:formate hydrogenlyase subunit 6/NADH:ubiquinone oxidoreductase subunit I
MNTHPRKEPNNGKSQTKFRAGFLQGLSALRGRPKKILRLNLENVNQKGYNPVECTDIEACIACAMCAVICPDSVIGLEREDA